VSDHPTYCDLGHMKRRSRSQVVDAVHQEANVMIVAKGMEVRSLHRIDKSV
jgi:hypothetical protein